MSRSSYDVLHSACQPGGASVLSVTTELEAAAGPHGAIAPAKFAAAAGARQDAKDRGVYAFEDRYLPGESDGAGSPGLARTVVVDSKASAINRIEQPLAAAIHDGHELLSKTPRIELTYEDAGVPTLLDLELPHRTFDGHVRAATIDGGNVTAHEKYIAARNSTNANLRPLLELSAAPLIFGGWDSYRKTRQVRLRSPLVGEVIGILTDQSGDAAENPPLRGSARTDPVSASFTLDKDLAKEIATRQSETGTIDAKKLPPEGSRYGLGHIPPSLSTLGLISCRRIIRSHVLSFATLRQYRFGFGVDGDTAVRALIATLALNGLVRSYDELYYRANCDLREASVPLSVLDARYGKTTEFELPTIDQADELLEQAIAKAVGHGLRWEGQVFAVVGDAHLMQKASTEEEGD